MDNINTITFEQLNDQVIKEQIPLRKFLLPLSFDTKLTILKLTDNGSEEVFSGVGREVTEFRTHESEYLDAGIAYISAEDDDGIKVIIR